MRANLLEILQCPYCAGSFMLDEGPCLRRSGDEIETGLLRCQCATYPVIDGIPVLLPGYGAESVFYQMLVEDPRQALYAMLGLDEELLPYFIGFLGSEDGTYRDCIDLFSPGSEGPYFVHRFANPTYLVGQMILRAVGGDRRCFARRAIDLAGGSGHLTRALCEISGGAEVFLAETNFWKLWIARRILAPQCIPVCFDAEAPLPFKPGSFSLAFCSDAFHYIWSKRLLAGEMIRLVGDDGVIIVNHAHNALQENHSVGLPLAPKWWRNLFDGFNPRVFKESDALESVIGRRGIDLSFEPPEEELNKEQAVFLIATKLSEIFRRYDYPGAQFTSGEWRINPLYVAEQYGKGAILRLKFPSESYEDEYQVCKRYLPRRLRLSASEFDPLADRQLAGCELTGELAGLAERYVALNLPKGYL